MVTMVTYVWNNTLQYAAFYCTELWVLFRFWFKGIMTHFLLSVYNISKVFCSKKHKKCSNLRLFSPCLWPSDWNDRFLCPSYLRLQCNNPLLWLANNEFVINAPYRNMCGTVSVTEHQWAGPMSCFWSLVKEMLFLYWGGHIKLWILQDVLMVQWCLKIKENFISHFMTPLRCR